ncbi:MAG: hypothetical protein WBP29_04810 [Candidatus Zixiibacteriota bacterium]
MRFVSIRHQFGGLVKRPSSKIAGQAGMTIVEVLVASLIASFAIAAGMGTFINTNENHIIQDGVTNMQQNGRATVDEVVGKVRQAGYKVPSGARALLSWNANPDTIAIVYMREPACTATTSHDMPQPSAELKCSGSDLSCFQADTWAYIWDPVAETGEYFYITQVQEAAGHLQHNTAQLSKKYLAGAQIYVLDYFKYYVDNSTDSTHPTFMKSDNGAPGVIYADDIVDMQLRYRMGSGLLSDTISVDRYVREVELTVIARTAKSDLFLNDYRYDTLTTSVMVRNFAL